LNIKTGAPSWQQEIPGEPLPGGLLVDRDGRIVVATLDGRLLAYRAQEP
jgi:outer membrane protein assembly factor BamB